MSTFKDITGQRFGRLVAIKRVGKKWLCKCDCGNEKEITTSSLLGGHSNSCGCLSIDIRAKRLQDSQDKICEVCGTHGYRVLYSKITNQYLCSRHYQQAKTYGHTKKTTQEPNDVIMCGDYAELILTNRLGDEIARAKVDTEDVEKTKKYRWCVHCKDGYVSTKINGNNLFLHQLVLNETSRNVDIDHILGDTFDNRKSMLRTCNHTENMQNVKVSINNKSGYSGVALDQSGKWKAYITFNKTRIHLGTFKNKQDAINARAVAEEKYFGEFANKREK